MRRLTRVVAIGLTTVVAHPVWGQSRLPTWTITPELRIDAAKEDLTGINYIAVSAKGIIAIGQTDDNKVLFYSASGERLGSYGRSGAGPGEFRGQSYLGWIADTLWAYDAGLNRFTYVTPTRHYLRDVSAPPLRPELADPACMVGRNPSLYCARPQIAAAPDSSRILTVTQLNPTSGTGHFTVTVTDRRGGMIFTKQLSTSAVALSTAYMDSVWKANHIDLSHPLARVAPKYAPPVMLARIGVDGVIWLRLAWLHGAKTINYMVLDASGNLLATPALPANLIVHQVSRNQLWAVETDANGMESVIRFRVNH